MRPDVQLPQKNQHPVMVNFLQINLRRSGTALSRMYMTAHKRNKHCILVSEFPRHPDGPRWIPSEEGKGAIVLTTAANFAVETKGSESGFVWIQSGGPRIYSIYFPPGRRLVFFRDQVAALESSVRSVRPELDLIVGGDFNAKSAEWGSTEDDERGNLLADMTAGLDLQTANVGNKPTFRYRASSSVIDVTFVCPRILRILR